MGPSLGLAKINSAAAIELAMSLAMGGKRSSVMNSVFSEWAEVDVIAAIAYTNKYERNGILSSLMGVWVDRDLSAALKWAQSQSNPQLREDATAAAVGAWAKADPAAALVFVQTIGDAETRSTAFKKAWGDWFRNNPEAATAYVASIKDEKLLEGVSFHFGYNTEGLSPKERAALLARLPEGKTKEAIVQTITFSQIRKGQFNEALSMLITQPDSPPRDRNVVQLGQAWAKADMAAATAWLKLQPDSTDRDLALTDYASILARTDPLAAINWVKSIPDQKLCQGALINIASSWSNADPTKAAVWINGAAGFSASEKRMIETYPKLSSDYMFNVPTVGTRR